MKIGIYISGLGQSVVDESVEKYAERLMNEIRFSTTRIDYEIRTEKVQYSEDRDSTVVSICEKGKLGRVVYKIYDFGYHQILTERFNNYPLILRNLWLFLLVIQKSPLIIKRLFIRDSYNRPFQTFYLFAIFLIISTAVLLMLPATLAVVTNFFGNQQVDSLISAFRLKVGVEDFPLFSMGLLENFSKVIVSVTALLLLVLPNANVLITNLATEFVCANDYIQYGARRQLLQGNLELLVDYITENENENDCKIHFHTYSFGSILAIDYIYPFGSTVSKNAKTFCEAIITVGSPFEFIKSYYPEFYMDRQKELGDSLCWINVYSIADALATNFRTDSSPGDAQFGIDESSNLPINLNYEVSAPKKEGIIDFLILYSVKVHGIYWDPRPEGQSCLRLVYQEMSNRRLVQTYDS